MHERAPLYIFTALACEAKPFIDHFKLKKKHDIHVFSIYQSQHIQLCVTGVGSIAMAAGVAYTLALYPPITPPILINIGIAGHQVHSIGQLFIAHKIGHVEQNRHYYPQIVMTAPCASIELITISQPDFNYHAHAAYEMEAFAFYEVASRFSSAELIHCFKIISDNSSQGIQAIKAPQVSTWIQQNLTLIVTYLTALQTLSIPPKITSETDYQQLIHKIHFSQTQRVQLKNLLAKRKVLMPELALNFSEQNASVILKKLSQALEQKAFGHF